MEDGTGFRWVPRLMRTRIVRRSDRTVGQCCECGVAFAGSVEQSAGVAQVWRAHESVCPGGDRAGEVVHPFPPSAVLEPSPVPAPA